MQTMMTLASVGSILFLLFSLQTLAHEEVFLKFYESSLKFPLQPGGNWELIGDANIVYEAQKIELVDLLSTSSLSYGGINSKRPLPAEFFQKNLGWTGEFDFIIGHNDSKQLASDFIWVLFTPYGTFIDYIAGPRFYKPETRFFGVVIELLEHNSAENAAQVHIYGISSLVDTPIHPTPKFDSFMGQSSCSILYESPEFLQLRLYKRSSYIMIKVNNCQDDRNIIDISDYLVGDAMKLHIAVMASSTSHGLRRSLSKIDFMPTLGDIMGI